MNRNKGIQVVKLNTQLFRLCVFILYYIVQKYNSFQKPNASNICLLFNEI